jgi:hypothetical protein
MRKHVELLGILYILWGGLFLLTGLAVLALGVGAAAIGASFTPEDAAGRLAATLTAVTFIVLAGVLLVWCVAHIWNGVALRRHGEWARAVGLVLGILDLFVLPFGTALGIYALWVLMNDQARPLFEVRPA